MHPARFAHLSRSAALIAALFASAAVPALASSHREAPMITQFPKVDNTDVYAFRSYEPGRSGFVTLIANFIPDQSPYAGPNFFMMDPDALYEIHIDNNGDGVEDITLQFRFKLTNKDFKLNVGGKNLSVPLVQSGLITDVDQATVNASESYTINVISGPSRGAAGVTLASDAASGGNTFFKPIDNIGNRTLPDYAGYAAKHVYSANFPGCATPGKVFVGQRREGFGVNLGEIFDLVNIPTANILGSRSGRTNSLAGKNVTSIAVELPIACVATAADPVIGVWSSASIPAFRNLAGPLGSTINGAQTQVSRLGMPLVNEVVIGLKDKDTFNMSQPKDDGQFLDYVANPTLPAILSYLYPVQAPQVFPRSDLIAVFLTGVAGVNQPKNVKPSEMIRLNTALPVTPKGSQNSLGAAACFVDGVLTLGNPGCDPAGFPNGRRPGDDVVDIALRVVMGYLLPAGPNKPASANLPYTDGVLVEDSQFDNAFPYLRTPFPGSPNGANGLAPNTGP